MQNATQRGVTTLMLIAFMGIFMIIIGTLSSYAIQESRYERALYAREQALHNAEAGIEYYRWYLAHNPNDLTNGTGNPGPYSYTVTDPETGETLGTASITIAGNTQCGVVQSIDITSRGVSVLDPGYPRTIIAHYMQPSVAGYSYLLNSNVWAGSSRTITGPYFSNGGIRMDGTNLSDVSSAVATWTCSTSYGCNPANNNAPGVLGSGSGSALWHWPVASIPFNNITNVLTSLYNHAKNDGGLYFPPASGTVDQRGYHLTFKNDGTVDVYRVTATTGVWGSPDGVNWVIEYNIIKNQTFVGNYTIPPACSVIFVEDRVWVDGVVGKKVIVASKDFVDVNHITSALLPNNITYSTYDGSVGLTVVAAGDVLIPLNSPDVMEIHGIFIAQTGRYGRNLYVGSGSHSVPTSPIDYRPYVLRSQLTTVGTILSNLRTGTAWGSASTTVSGYQTRIDSYDQLQATNPPPFTPTASVSYQFISWREQ